MARTPVALAWSGGKDSALALDALRNDPGIELVALITTVTAGDGRIAIHGVPRSVLHAQAAALGIGVTEVPLGPRPTNAEYEAAFATALSALRTEFQGLARIAFGDLFLADIRAYRESQFAALGWQPLFPLWQRDTTELAREFIARDFHAILTCVDTSQIGAHFAGREFDAALLAELPSNADPCGENGEFHTCVYAGPIFRHALTLRTGARSLRDARFSYCDVTLDEDAPPP